MDWVAIAFSAPAPRSPLPLDGHRPPLQPAPSDLRTRLPTVISRSRHRLSPFAFLARPRGMVAEALHAGLAADLRALLRAMFPLISPPSASFTPPPGYARIRVVGSFAELVATPLAEGINALCWPRVLPGNFGEVVVALGIGEGIVTLDDERLARLPVSAAGRTAIEVLLSDQRWLREQERDPVLNCIYGYPRDEEPGPVATDVFSFHADSAPVEADTWLCTYHGVVSEGLRNDEAQRRVDIPETRAELLRLFGGEDGDEFREFLAENCYDLHYAPAPGAQPFSFGLGHLWRIAVDWPGSAVPPCIHRAPLAGPADEPRLLLIC